MTKAKHPTEQDHSFQNSSAVLRTAKPASNAELPDSTAIDGIEVSWLFQSASLRISCWTCQCSDTAWSDDRSQPWHALGFLHHGAFLFEVGGQASVMDATSVMLLNPGQTYRTRHPFGCGDHGSALVVAPSVLAEIMLREAPAAVRDTENPLFPTAVVATTARGYLLQRLLFERLRRFSRLGGIEIEEVALDLVEETIRSCYTNRGNRRRRASTERDHRERAEAAKALLVERYREPLRLEDIASRLAISPFHLSRLFKRETGVPIHCYLNRLRLRDALSRVTAGCGDLTDLALELGFSSHSHFTASFSREYGLPPSAILGAANSGRWRDILASPYRGEATRPSVTI